MLAVERGWSYKNFDISKVAVEFCRGLRLDAETFPAEGTPPLEPDSTDVIVMWEVLEHVWNVREYLKTIVRALRPGGIFLMSTPNYRSPELQDPKKWGTLSSPPVHVNYFDMDALKFILAEAGFGNIRLYPRRIYMPERNLRSIARSLRFALRIDQPPTIDAICII